MHGAENWKRRKWRRRRKGGKGRGRRRGWRGWSVGQRGRRGRTRGRGEEGSLSKISSEETLSKLRLKLNQNKAKSTKHAGRPADYLKSGFETFWTICSNCPLFWFKNCNDAPIWQQVKRGLPSSQTTFGHGHDRSCLWFFSLTLNYLWMFLICFRYMFLLLFYNLFFLVQLRVQIAARIPHVFFPDSREYNVKCGFDAGRRWVSRGSCGLGRFLGCQHGLEVSDHWILNLIYKKSESSTHVHGQSPRS